MTLQNLAIVLTVLAFEAGPALAQSRIRAGQYEVTGEVDGQPIKRLECVTAEEARDFPMGMLTEDDSCKLSDVKTIGQRVTFKTTCKADDIVSYASYDMTFGDDWYKGDVTADTEGTKLSMKVNARRVGECKN